MRLSSDPQGVDRPCFRDACRKRTMCGTLIRCRSALTYSDANAWLRGGGTHLLLQCSSPNPGTPRHRHSIHHNKRITFRQTRLCGNLGALQEPSVGRSRPIIRVMERNIIARRCIRRRAASVSPSGHRAVSPPRPSPRSPGWSLLPHVALPAAAKRSRQPRRLKHGAKSRGLCVKEKKATAGTAAQRETRVSIV